MLEALKRDRNLMQPSFSSFSDHAYDGMHAVVFSLSTLTDPTSMNLRGSPGGNMEFGCL